MRKNITATILALLALSVLTLTLKTQPVKADPGYIYIRSDGSIYPPGRPIQRNGDYYTMTGDLSEGIRIERDNMTLDGSSYKISGASYTGIGVNVTDRSRVMLKNLNIHKFQNGIAFINSSFCQLYHSDIEGGLTSDDASIGVNVTNSAQITLYNDTARAYRSGIKLFGSSYNRVFNCTSFWNNGGDMVEGWGIDLASASNFNDVFDNYVADNHDGIGIQADSSNSSIATYNNSINYNTIFDSSWHGEGIGLYSSTYNNTITRNNFWNNTLQANVVQSYNDSWDGGYPSYTLGGNHWSDYTGTYNESTHIGETPYNITSDNKDNYPLEFYNYTYEYLTVQSAGNGTTDPVPDTYPYPYPGMNVTATANADPGYVFDHWVLDGTTNMTDNPVTIAMDSSHTLRSPPPKPCGTTGAAQPGSPATGASAQAASHSHRRRCPAG